MTLKKQTFVLLLVVLGLLFTVTCAIAADTTQVESEVQFDSMGRVWRVRQKMPSGSWSVTETLYRADGAKASVSETVTDPAPAPSWTAPSVANRTTYTYDVLGRVTAVLQADGSTATAAYDGAQKTTRTATVNTGTQAVTVETTDWQGRLVRVQDPVGTVGEYRYDAADHLVTASAGPDAGPRQTRTFNYDGRGLLLSEQHPELGISGGATYAYTYDARGHVTKRAGGKADLRYDYDALERLIAVKKDTTGTVLKTFQFGTSNTTTTPASYALGQLVAAERWNPATFGGTLSLGAAIRESYAYGGPQGEVTLKTTTQCNGAQCTTTNGTVTNAAQTFTQSFFYDQLGFFTAQQYPTSAAAMATNPSRAIGYTYVQGFLKTVPSYATLDYHPNSLVSSVAHGNNVTDTIGLAGSGMARPASIGNSSGLPVASYTYDPSGNITAIGSDSYVYDAGSRLTSASLTTTAGIRMQTASYDAYGNIAAKSTNAASGLQSFTMDATAMNVLAASNRLSPAAYDAAGSLESSGGMSYAYDDLGMLTSVSCSFCVQPSVSNYWYTADDERIVAYRQGNSSQLWSLRGLDHKVLRDYKFIIGNSSWIFERDYIYRDGQLLADVDSTGAVSHYTLDHLGTPRVATGAQGTVLYAHKYFPFGEDAEMASSYTDPDRMRFTGHERDFQESSSSTPYLDYMHARYYSASMGRFLSLDPTWSSADTGHPQSWNRYAYVENNPMGKTDPDGRCGWGMLAGGIGCAVEDVLRGVVRDYHETKEAVAGMRGGATNSEKAMGAAVITLEVVKYGAMFAAPESAEAPAVAEEAAAAIEGSLAGGAREINATGSRVNCVNCAATMDNFLATGREASALPGGPKPITELGPLADWKQMGSQQKVISAMEQAGNGARGVVFGAEKPGATGHVFNVVNQNGVINFVDAQTGKGAVFDQAWGDVRLLRKN